MTPRLTRRIVAAFGVGGAALLLIASTAWACAVLTTTGVSQASGPPGTTLTVTGQHFGVAHGDVAQTFSPVEVRFDSLTGPLLATANADATGAISVQVTIPQDAAPGYHVLLTLQKSPTGAPVPGSPGRVMFQVGSSQAAVGSASASASLRDATPATSTSGSLGPVAIALMVSGGLLLLSVIGATVGVSVWDARKEARRQAAKA